MNTEAAKIIKWALEQHNNYGGHIYALCDVVKSGRITGDTLEAINRQLEQWSAQK